MDDKGMGDESASVNIYQGELLAGGTAEKPDSVFCGINGEDGGNNTIINRFYISYFSSKI